MTPFIGQIMLFAGNFAPRGWAMCDGQLLPIAQYSALFSILGTTYGGDGRTTFALPDLRGRVAIQQGRGPGLSAYQIGEKGGQETVTLTASQIPSHSHSLRASSSQGTFPPPANNSLAQFGDTASGGPYVNEDPNVTMHSGSIGNAGGNMSHPNMQPFLTLTYVIALEGIFPSRN